VGAPRLTREHSLTALATRVRHVGQEDDPVTRATCARLAKLGAAKPPATVREIRALPIDHDYVARPSLVQPVQPRDSRKLIMASPLNGASASWALVC
jgi:hypothetical protein